MSSINLRLLKEWIESGDLGSITEHYKDCFSVEYSYEGEVKAKQRPRVGKGGRVFTPKETRNFEASVKSWAREVWEGPAVRFPVSVNVLIYEKGTAHQILECECSIKFPDKADIDNLAKSILDGVNGVMFVDDSQISDLSLSRVYSVVPGFHISITRAGLTPMEYSNLKRKLK